MNFLITRKLSILANCSLWSNETMYVYHSEQWKTHTCMYLFPFFIIKEFIEVQTANCSLWSNGAMYFELKFISNDAGKWLYSFNHLLHSDLSTIYFPRSLNKLKLFPFPSDFSNTNHATRKKTLQKQLSCFPQQDNLPLGLTDVIFYIQVMILVAFPYLPSQMAK